jgi:8-oxo-dGTP diphosphatase
MVGHINVPVALRVCAAVIRDGAILMVRHVHDGRDYWTLPGGLAEPGETLEQAALRELQEEANLTGRVVRPLYQRAYRSAVFRWSTTGYDVTEHCFLIAIDDEQHAVLGNDPELDAPSQMLVELAWRALDDLREDLQVARVLAVLSAGERPT